MDFANISRMMEDANRFKLGQIFSDNLNTNLKLIAYIVFYSLN